MSTLGFIIKQSNVSNLFFTSTSSYDRPQWVSISEAKIYPTPEMANQALMKLYSYGYITSIMEQVPEMKADEQSTDTKVPVIDDEDSIDPEDLKIDDSEEDEDDQINESVGPISKLILANITRLTKDQKLADSEEEYEQIHIALSLLRQLNQYVSNDNIKRAQILFHSLSTIVLRYVDDSVQQAFLNVDKPSLSSSFYKNWR